MKSAICSWRGRCWKWPKSSTKGIDEIKFICTREARNTIQPRLPLHPHRKEGKDDQLMAAQTYLKLGEVSAESGMNLLCFPSLKGDILN